MFNVTLVPLAFDFDNVGEYFLFLFHILFGTTAVVVAGSVALSILLTRTLRVQNRFIFMLNTSICDTLSGVGVFYVCLFDVRVGILSKNSTFYIVPSLLGVNILTILLAQFDRYFAVCHPFFYSRYISLRLVIGINAITWIYVYLQLLIQHMLPLYKAVLIQIYGMISLQFMVLTKITMTIKLIIVAKYQLDREPPSPEKDSKKESLLIIVLVVVFFLVLWLPSFVNIILRRMTTFGIPFENEAVNPIGILSRCNVLTTPSLYLWGSPSLRTAVWESLWGKVFGKLKRRKLFAGNIKVTCALDTGHK